MVKRKFTIGEADLVQEFAAHGVIAAGDFEARRLAFDQNAANAIAPGPALTSLVISPTSTLRRIASACSPLHTPGRRCCLIASGAYVAMMRDLAERRHGGDVAGLGDLLEHKRVSSTVAPRPPYGSGHAEDPELREACYPMLMLRTRCVFLCYLITAGFVT